MTLEVTARSLQVVSFPQFSRVQDERDELKRSVLSCLRMSATVTIPALTGIALTSDLLVAAVGPKWSDSAGVLRILAVVGMPLIFAQFTGPLLQALSRPRHLAVITWALAGVSVATLCVVGFVFKNSPVHAQTEGFAIARVVSSALVFAPIMLFILARLSGISLREFVGAVAPSFVAAAVMTLALGPLSFGTVLKGWKPISALLLEAFVGLVTASATLLLLDNRLRTLVLSSIRPPLRTKYVETELT
jgi:O-antigen/teichoic acid export membrane protein